MNMDQLEALRGMYNEAKQLMEYAHRLYCQEEASADEVEELDSMLSDCIDALTELEGTLANDETEEETA